MIRILIADDQPSIRLTLQSQLSSFTDIEIVGTAENGRKAIEQAAQLQPDVVLLDLEMPVLDGYGAAAELKARLPQIKILVLTAQNDSACLLPALRAGAHGYLLKGTPAEDLANAIRSVQKGHFQIGPGVVEPTENPVMAQSVAQGSVLERTLMVAPEGTRLAPSTPSPNGLVKSAGRALAKSSPTSIAIFDRPVLLQQSPLWSRVIIWGIVLSTTAVVAWACLFKFDEAIPAAGQLEPQGAVKDVQSPVTGVVKSILVKDGQQVKKGDVLLTLDPKGAQSELASLRRVRESLMEENAFYRQLMQQSSASFSIPIPSRLSSPQMLALAGLPVATEQKTTLRL